MRLGLLYCNQFRVCVYNFNFTRKFKPKHFCWPNKQLIYFQNITIDSPLEYSNLLADSTKTGPSEMPHLFSVCVRGQRWAPLPLLPEYQHWPRTQSKKRWDNSGGPVFAECIKHGPKFGVLCRRINRYILEINEWFIHSVFHSVCFTLCSEYGLNSK